jgi:hypothetical protein
MARVFLELSGDISPLETPISIIATTMSDTAIGKD